MLQKKAKSAKLIRSILALINKVKTADDTLYRTGRLQLLALTSTSSSSLLTSYSRYSSPARSKSFLPNAAFAELAETCLTSIIHLFKNLNCQISYWLPDIWQSTPSIKMVVYNSSADRILFLIPLTQMLADHFLSICTSE